MADQKKFPHSTLVYNGHYLVFCFSKYNILCFLGPKYENSYRYFFGPTGYMITDLILYFYCYDTHLST